MSMYPLPLPGSQWTEVFFNPSYIICHGDFRCIYINRTDLKNNLSLEIWVLKDHNSGEWCLVHKIQLSYINAKASYPTKY